MLKPTVYSLQFRGRVSPHGPDVSRLMSLTPPSSAPVARVGAEGVRGHFNEVPGGETIFTSDVSFGDEPGFGDLGEIHFGRRHTLRSRNASKGAP